MLIYIMIYAIVCFILQYYVTVMFCIVCYKAAAFRSNKVLFKFDDFVLQI